MSDERYACNKERMGRRGRIEGREGKERWARKGVEGRACILVKEF